MTQPGAQTPPRALVPILRTSARFAWTELPTIVAVSVLWLLASLPVVTVGPATLGAYAAVLAKREAQGDEFDDGSHAVAARVAARVRRGFMPSIAIGLVPLPFAAIGAFYVIQFLRTGSVLFGVLAFGALLVGAQLSLLAVPSLVYLAAGQQSDDAFRAGYAWTITDPRLAVGTGILTIAVGVGLLTLTIAFVFLFGGVAAAFHVTTVLPEPA